MSTRNTHFGRLLRDKRTESDVTLGKVAGELGCSVSYVSDVEHGRRNPFSNDQLAKLSQLLKCSLDELMRAAAMDQQSVRIDSDREEVLEVASIFARFATSSDVEGLNNLREYLEQQLEGRRGRK